MANRNFSAKDIHVFTLYLSRARMLFSLSSEERMPLPSSIVDDKEAITVMKAFLETDTATHQTIDDSDYVNPEDILDEIFMESNNYEKLEILSHCYSSTGLFSKIYEFHGSGQGDFIAVLSAAPSEEMARESAYEVKDMAFPPEDDEIYESSSGRFDGSVYTIVKGPGGQFKYDASLSSSFEMPHPSEVFETISGEDLDTLIQDIGIDEYENLDSQFEQSSTKEKLYILQDCFRTIGDTYTDIAIAKFDGIEAYVLCVAPSAGQAQSLGDDIIKEIQTRVEDGTLHEDILENEDTDADTVKLAKIMPQMRKKSKLTKDDMRTLVDAWKKIER